VSAVRVKTRRRTWAAAAVASLLARAPEAWGCPVCFGAGDDNVLWFYYLSTVMLSLLPFAIVGTIAAVVLWLRRQEGEAFSDLPRG